MRMSNVLLFIVAFAATAALMRADDGEERDYYAELGIQRDASMRAIRKAFRKLSVKYHPDKNPGNAEAAKMFQKVSEAYEVLSDEDKKFLYDEGGTKAVEEAEKPQAQDPFAAFFGGGRQQRNAKKGPDAKMNMAVTLEQLYNGQMVDQTISRLEHCRGCKGSHSAECRKCTTRCPDEVKTVLRQVAPGFNVQQQQQVRSQEKCRMGQVALKVQLERGMDTGETITFKGKSERRPGLIPGDLHVVLQTQKHHRFRRDGSNLHFTMHITLKEALAGFTKNIPHLDGHVVEVEQKKVTQPFQVRTFKGEGFPVHNFPSQKGDLHVKFHIDFPSRLTQGQRDVFDEILVN